MLCICLGVRLHKRLTNVEGLVFALCFTLLVPLGAFGRNKRNFVIMVLIILRCRGCLSLGFRQALPLFSQQMALALLLLNLQEQQILVFYLQCMILDLKLPTTQILDQDSLKQNCYQSPVIVSKTERHREREREGKREIERERGRARERERERERGRADGMDPDRFRDFVGSGIT